jgi:hypothetical protein
VTVHRVDVKPWGVDDVSTALQSHNPLFRPILGRVLFDLHHHLPGNLSLYQPRRIFGSPRCFWYERTCVNDRRLQFFSLVVRDADPRLLDVIWVVPTA